MPNLDQDVPAPVSGPGAAAGRGPRVPNVVGLMFRKIAASLATSVVMAVVACVCVALPLTPAVARVARPFDLGTIAVAQLPPQGQQVLQAIKAGGPFVSRRDGITFANREGILPPEPRGYYAEYTVPTPGARTRGARRIIAGRGTTGDFRTSNEYYYTNDHYQSFRRIVQ